MEMPNQIMWQSGSPFFAAGNSELDICNKLGHPRCENFGFCHNAYHAYDGDVDYYCDCSVGYIGHNCETRGKFTFIFWTTHQFSGWTPGLGEGARFLI